MEELPAPKPSVASLGLSPDEAIDHLVEYAFPYGMDER
jgi:hypothetical protein